MNYTYLTYNTMHSSIFLPKVTQFRINLEVNFNSQSSSARSWVCMIGHMTYRSHIQNVPHCLLAGERDRSTPETLTIAGMDRVGLTVLQVR